MRRTRFVLACLACASTAFLEAQLAIRGDKVYTMSGPPIADGVVLVRGSKIERVGRASEISIPSDYKLLRAKVVTPGLVDAHSTVGLTGYLNQPHDQDMLEKSAPIQPELRAIDAYDGRDRLVGYIRGFGVTTIHTGHGPGALISGQTMIAKTAYDNVERATMVPLAMVAATLGEGARAETGKSPGTRAKMIAMLREEFIKAQEYSRKREKPATEKEKDKDKDKEPPARDLRTEMTARMLKGEVPLLVTVHRANDILSTIRLGQEFHLKIVLDGVAEAYLVLPEIKASGYPVILHPTMYRSGGETENLSMTTAAKLRDAGIPFALESGFEDYVPKTRVILFEAAIAAANGLSFEEALATITASAARIIGVWDRVGSLDAGKDGDLALYDGDPFEYTTHCTGVVIDGQVVSTAQN
ncbi:MAG: amidohydrolase family protein [Acidobacteriia bacterium]|nr:amidohydrolase family protein [Terriglobia bacterium]